VSAAFFLKRKKRRRQNSIELGAAVTAAAATSATVAAAPLSRMPLSYISSPFPSTSAFRHSSGKLLNQVKLIATSRAKFIDFTEIFSKLRMRKMWQKNRISN